MKFLVVLVIAFLAGCDGRQLKQRPQPKQQVNMVKEAFWDYVAKATSSAQESLRQIQASELGKEVNDLIAESTRAVNTFGDTVRTQVTPLTQELMGKISQEAEHLRARVEADLSAAGAGLQPYAEELVAELQKQVGGLKSEAAPLAQAADPEALRALVLQRSLDLKAQLESQMVPLGQELKQKMEQSLEEFQKSLVPVAQNFQEQVTRKVQELQKSLVPLGEELKVSLGGDARQIKKQLVTLWKSFAKMIQQ